MLRHLEGALRGAGWTVKRSGEPGAPLLAVRSGERVPIQFRVLMEPRRALLQALLADAILEGRATAPPRGRFLAVVGAPAVSDAMASSLAAYAGRVAPGQAFGLVDARGLVRFHGRDLEEASRDPAPGTDSSGQRRPRELFSDLNQWMLKVLLGRRLPPELLHVPRTPVRSGAQLAQQASVSGPVAWRLLAALKEGGYLDAQGEVVRVRDLLWRWRAVASRPVQQVGASWILPGRSPMVALRSRLAELRTATGVPACLGLFAACEALGLGHVRGAPVHLYVGQIDAGLLARLGLVAAGASQQADVLVRVPRWPATIFRGVVAPGGVPVSDVLQCWLDVAAEPTRGQEQANLLWKRVLGPALGAGVSSP